MSKLIRSKTSETMKMRKNQFQVTFLCLLCILGSQSLMTAQENSLLPCSSEHDPMPSKDISAYVSAMESGVMRQLTDTLIIPLVIHNLTWNHIGYIPDHDFVEVVQKINDRLANRGEFYNPAGVDTRIRVRLPNVDPQGNPTNGITHLEHPQVLDFDRIVPSNLRWDDERYLNAYIYDGDEGWAYYPWSTTNTTYMMIGFERARLEEGIITWVHEIGHVFGLLHTHEGCATLRCLELGDMVCDTWPDKVSFQPCFDMDSCEFDVDPDDPENYLEGLNTLDMIDNYMDGGLCRSRFTEGQVERMHWVQQMYKPDWGKYDTLFRSCPPLKADFSIDEEYLEVNQSIRLDALEEGDYEYAWYSDNRILSNEKVVETSFAEAGVYRIRLDISAVQGECAGVIWSREQSISVRCIEDESLRISIPDRMVLDSCYELKISGVSNLSWRYEDMQGSSAKINMCPSISGLQELHISYGTGACQSEEVLHYMIHANPVRERSYFQQDLRFDADSASSQDFVDLYEVGEESYRLLGTENHARMQFDKAERHQNFIRTWFPFEKVGYEWELYHDSLLVLVETDHITYLQLNYLDMVEDTLDGSKYYLAYEHYTNTQNSGLILGKLNVLGKPIWTKRILKPDYHFYEGKLDNNKFIHLMGDDLLINMNQILCKVNKQGQVLSAVGLNRSPSSLYDRPMNSHLLAMTINGDKIHYSQLISVVDTTLYPTHTDSIGNIYVTALWTGLLDENLELESSRFYKHIDRDNEIFGRRSFVSSKYKDGILIFYRMSRSFFPNPSLTQFHFIYVDQNNMLADYKVIEHSNGQTRSPSLPFLEVLSNDEILFGHPLRNGKLLEYYRIDADWEEINMIGSTVLPDTVDIVGAIKNHWSTTRRPAQPSVLTQDGILANFYTRGSNPLIDKNNFYLLPLDHQQLTCAPFTHPFEVIDTRLDLHNLQPDVTSQATRIEMEDIYLKRSVRTFVSETVCEQKYTPEDYSVAILDTICDPSGTLEIKVEICREDRLPQDTISLDFYSESPLEQVGAPFLEEDLLFLEGQSCVQKTYFMQDRGIYIFVNGDAESKRPYTLSKTFFDANEGLEYDYTNNMIYANICENMVSTEQKNIESIALNVYPNPATQVLNINLEQESIIDLEIYSSIGALMHKAKINASKNQIDLKSWTSGLYIIKARVSDGRSAIVKFTKLDSF